MFSWEAIISKLRSCQELLDKCESNVSSVRTTVRPHPLIEKSRQGNMREMKIGFICQPFDNGGPPDPGGSIGLLTWELARRLSRSCQVVVCAPRFAQHAAHEQWEGVQFYRFRLRPDHWLLDRPRGLSSPVDGSRKDVDSILYCPVYALRSANSLRAYWVRIIHIHNFSQFVPIARLFNRRAKIVLHMNCDWLCAPRPRS